MKDSAPTSLALGLCSEGWFRGAIDGLTEAEKSVPLAGSALVTATAAGSSDTPTARLKLWNGLHWSEIRWPDRGL